MILPDMPLPVPWPPKHEVMDKVADQEDGEHGFLELCGKLGRIRDYV